MKFIEKKFYREILICLSHGYQRVWVKTIFLQMCTFRKLVSVSTSLNENLLVASWLGHQRLRHHGDTMDIKIAIWKSNSKTVRFYARPKFPGFERGSGYSYMD
jgi:hypothetical protein